MNVDDGQGGMITPSQDGFKTNDVFNEQIPMISDDDGIINSNQDIIDSWDLPEAADESLHQEDIIDENIFDDPPAPLEDESIFEDPLVDEFTKDEDKEDLGLTKEAMIAKLKEEGYHVSKEETLPEDQVDRIELNRLSEEQKAALEFVNKTDDEKIDQKVRDDIAKEYLSLGRQDQIGGTDYEYDVSLKIERINQNEATKQMYADNITKGVQAYADSLDGKKQEIIAKQETKIKRETAERRSNLQSSLKQYLNKPFMGLDVTQEMAVNAYNEVTSGKFTEEINNNPTLVAEFALFKQNREAIMANAGGATYGEGVKAGVESIINGKTHTSRSSLHQAMTTSSKASGPEVLRRQAWSMPVVKESTEQAPVAPIQTPGSYVAGRGNS